MAVSRVTPATITYASNDPKAQVTQSEAEVDKIPDEELSDEQKANAERDKETFNTVRFHCVVSEDHEITNKITKFPVQTGFEVSNHAIKQNRKISLEGMISNTVLEQSNQAIYSSNNSRTVFDVLQTLVQGAIPCKVVTNLGVYTPVIFTKFKTKQAEGLTDAILVSIQGEEIQVAETLSKPGPTELSFKVAVPDEVRAIDEYIESQGKRRCGDSVSKAEWRIGDDFQLKVTDPTGSGSDTTYTAVGYDPVSKRWSYAVHTDNFHIYDDGKKGGGGSSSTHKQRIKDAGYNMLLGGSGFTGSACMYDGGSGVEDTSGYTDSHMGEVSIGEYGVEQEVVVIGGPQDEDWGSSLTATGIDMVHVTPDLDNKGDQNSNSRVIDDDLSYYTELNFDGIEDSIANSLEAIEVIGDSIRISGTEIPRFDANLIKDAPQDRGPLSNSGVLL